jgi:hypothetical protein
LTWWCATPLALLRNSAETGGEESSSRYQTRIPTKSGEVRLLEVTVDILKLDGRMAALISALDVTPRAQLARGPELVLTRPMGVDNARKMTAQA